LGVIGNWVGYLYGFAGNTYQKGATFFESIDGNARGKFHIALNDATTAANVTLADARLTITSAGNVGIGTASPTGTANRFVNIYGAASNELHLTNATTGTGGTDGFTILQSGTDVYAYNYESGFFEIGTSAVSRLRVVSAGNVLINTTTDAGQRLQINSSLRLVPTSTVPTASAGTLYYDTATNKLKLYDGTSWVDLN